MKLRSTQFVLLVLLFTSLSLSEGSTLRLANDVMGQSALSVRSLAGSVARNVPTKTAGGRSHAVTQAAPVRALAASHRPWTMRAPAAHAAAVQTRSSLPDSAA